MKNRPTKRNSEERFRVIQFDELHYKNPSLPEYIKSLKTWFHKAAAAPSNNRKRDVATSTKAVRKSRSGNVMAMRSNSSNVLRKYTRSRTLSVMDLKRLFLVNSVFSLDRPESSRIFSKKRSLRTKVKNGEEYLNKWDRDIKVLYSNETNKFSRSGSQNSPDPSPTDAEVPSSSSSTVDSSHKMGVIINACNCGRKECKSILNHQVHDICDYPSKYCTSEEVCPVYVGRFPREHRQNKACQGSDANEKTCTCCFPNFPKQKLAGPNTDYARPSSPLCTCGSKRKKTGPKIDHTLTNMSYNINTKCYCPKQKPETHSVDTQTTKKVNKASKRKKGVLISENGKTQTSNEICTLCYCPVPKTDYANTQTSNNEFKCRCPKTDNANTQTSKKTCSGFGYPKMNKASPTDYSDTQTSSNKSPSYYPKRTKAVPKSHQTTQTFIDFFACGCSKQKETGYGYNLVRGSPMQKVTRHARLRASMTNGAKAKDRNKLKHVKEFQLPESASQRDHNKLRTYFAKLRRRNIERQIYRNVAWRRLKNAHKQSGLASTTTTDKTTSGQPTSRTRREAALSSMKLCPYCCCSIFPDSPLYSTDTTSQTKEPHRNTSAQTSIQKSPRVCSCLQAIVKNQEVAPDQKRQYILYHNRVRGWLVKPLRKRQSSKLGVKLGPTKTQVEKPGHVIGSTAHRDVFNKPVGNHDCNCIRNDNRCDCPNNSNKCSCSRWFRESSFGNLRVRNPSRNNLFRNIYKKSLTRNDHGKDCSKNAYECFYSLYAQESNLCRNVHKNLPRHAPAHNSSINIHKCNCSNLRNSAISNGLSKSDGKCYNGKRNIQSYNRQYPKVCSSVINPSSFCPSPCCRKDKKCMTKTVHICYRSSITTRLKKAIRKCFCRESKNSPVGCEWLFCSTPHCACCEFCEACKKCCKTLFLVITAVLWCPVLILVFILHDLFFPCY